MLGSDVGSNVGSKRVLAPETSGGERYPHRVFDSAAAVPQIAPRRPVLSMTDRKPGAWGAVSFCARAVAMPLILIGFALAGCSTSLPGGMFGSREGPVQTQPGPDAGLPAAGGMAAVRVGLVLPLSAGGNAGAAAQSMKNAADLALAEFGAANIQLIVKDSHGNAQGARAGVQAAIEEGAEIVLGPLFSPSVAAAGQVAKARHIPMIAFSTDTNVATSGVYLLSFLPESDVDRVVRYAALNGKRSIVAMLPNNAYGSVVQAQLQEGAAQRGARIVSIQRYPEDAKKIGEAARHVAEAARHADTVFIAGGADFTPQLVQALAKAGLQMGRIQFIGTGLWDDPALFSNPQMNGAWFAAPDASGYNAFRQRYRARFGSDPVRTASLAYDAVSLVAALVKTQPQSRFSRETLTSPSGFSGIDGVFRFRRDGTNERGLAVMAIRDGSAQTLSPAPRSFTGAGAVAAAAPAQ
jgi:ABC-type branched-subunit amino acid transport system substrate-binding protein